VFDATIVKLMKLKDIFSSVSHWRFVAAA